MENYNQARPFSSFFPGIAGLLGKPMWVFLHQPRNAFPVSVFATERRDARVLSRNKAYALTPLFGFRTFIAIKKAVPGSAMSRSASMPAPSAAKSSTSSARD